MNQIKKEIGELTNMLEKEGIKIIPSPYDCLKTYTTGNFSLDLKFNL